MTILTASEARTRLYGLLDEAAESHEPIQISGKRNNAVLVSEEDWRAIRRDPLPPLYARDAGVHPQRPADLGAESAPAAQLVMPWQVVFTPQAQKDARKLARSGLRPRAEELLALLARNPFETPPRFEKLVGDLAGAYSRRINIQRRLCIRCSRRSVWSRVFGSGPH